MQTTARAILCTVLVALCACRAPDRNASGAPLAASAASAAAHRESVKPGINKDFLDPALEVGTFVERFETESREVFAQRATILDLMGLRPGMSAADIGAGTGLFTLAMAERVGPKGRVFAVDIAEPFIERLGRMASERGLAQVTPVLCTQDDVRLAPDSIDLAFVCDTYHHFEYPDATLATIRRALRPQGQLLVIDMKRIEGVSREWTLNHVRAGEDVFLREILGAGFELVERPVVAGLEENYALRFRKR